MKKSTALFLVFFAAVAQAHDDATLDAMKAPHGGQIRMAGAYHLELVVSRDSKEAKENPIVLHVTDHAEKKVDTKGLSATATLLSGKVKATAALSPDGDNRLKGVARYASDPGLKVVISLKLPGGQVEQARFTPLASPK